MPRTEAALGFRAHSGWAVVVAVAAETPILRRRIEMVKGTGFRAKQPYHAAENMELSKALAFLEKIRKLAVEMAAEAIQDVVDELNRAGYRVRRAAVLTGSGKPLPELARILAAHPLIHTAEGVFFRDVLKAACEQCGLAVAGIKERELPAELLARIAALGKPLGSPWTQDEKFSTAAAFAANKCIPTD